MGVVRTAIALTGWGSLAATAGFFAWTRNSRVQPLAATDYLLNSTLHARYNPNRAPVTQDVCIRRVPFSSIRSELLEGSRGGKEDGKLVEALCRGVWGGLGYAYQRRYLEKKYRSAETASQLWDRSDLLTSTYPTGTQITDHFEVLSHTPTSIIVRCGDSPRKTEVRDSDGLFEMVAEVKEAEGVVEFGLKSVFYNGLAPAGKPDDEGPMGPWTQWAHGMYDKVLMESALAKTVLK